MVGRLGNIASVASRIRHFGMSMFRVLPLLVSDGRADSHGEKYWAWIFW